MNGFIDLLSHVVKQAGVTDACINCKESIELPGFFRPTKQWDMLVVVEGKLLVVLEAKSQVGPSFGNNFNNRGEEALGSAVDLWTAYRDGAFRDSPKPWLGYLFLLEDCPRSTAPVSVSEPHFQVFPEFVGASYAKRYEILCRKLIRERHYEAAAFLTSRVDSGLRGDYVEPASDLTIFGLVASLTAHVSAFAMTRKEGL